jgi:RNA polymerase sigma-70 factor (ECF subfamily)
MVAVIKEAELTLALVENLNDGFVAVVRCFQDKLYGYALRQLANPQDAEEVVQDAFVRAYRAIQRYPPERIRDLALKAWLYQITLNLCRNKVRGKHLVQVSLTPANEDQPEYDPPADDSESPNRLSERKETGRELAEVVAGLPEKFRQAVSLRHIAGLDYNEMAVILKQPVGTIKSNVHRGIKLMREEMTKTKVSEFSHSKF